ALLPTRALPTPRRKAGFLFSGRSRFSARRQRTSPSVKLCPLKQAIVYDVRETRRSAKFAFDNLENLSPQMRLARAEQPPFQLAGLVAGMGGRCALRDLDDAGLNANHPRARPLRALDDEPAISKVTRQFLGRGLRQGRYLLDET